MRHPLLAAETGLDIHVKHENHNPTGAFKVRGGLNLIASLSSDERARGVITRQHRQSRPVDRVRVAARRRAVHRRRAARATIPTRTRRSARFGATVVEHGKDFDDAREWVEREAEARGLRYVHSANEPLLIAGVGTYALEIFEDLPDPDVISRADRRRQRRVRMLHRPNRPRKEARASSACRRPRPMRLRARGADRERVSMERIGTFAEGLATRYTFDLDVRHSEARARRYRHADRSGARGGRAHWRCAPRITLPKEPAPHHWRRP